MPRVVLPLAVYLHTQLCQCTSISFVDSTSLSVCTNARIARHQIFRADARRGRASGGAGSTASSCTWLSMIEANCQLSV
ncbi:MAG: transposase [Ktedonobacterales bacterium]